MTTIGKEIAVMEIPLGNWKEKEVKEKVKEKVILVRGNIVSGVNGKSLSMLKFTTVVCNIPGATSNDMVHHIISFAEKIPKKLIAYTSTNDTYSNIDTIWNYEKIYNYVKTNSSKTELISQKFVAGKIEKESWMKWKHWIRGSRTFIKVRI